MAEKRRKAMAGLAALVAFSLFVCPLGWAGGGRSPANAANDLQIEFTPHVTQFDPVVATALAMGQFMQIEEGAFWQPSYTRVDCGDIEDDLCYEICYAGTCHTYGNDDDRVERFVDQVDQMQDAIDDLEIERLEGDQSIIDAVGTCLAAGGAGLAGYAAVAGLVAPDPTITKIVGVVAGVAAIAICGASVYGATTVQSETEQNLIDDIIEHGRAAVTEFQDLERDPAE